MGRVLAPITTPEFLIEVQKGNVPGHSLIHKFGRNDAVPNASWAHVSLLPFDITDFRQSAITMRVKAGNAADTAAGAGAREITIQGIDSAFANLSEAVATAGESASSATSATFWRVHRAWVSACGTYSAANTAAVVIEDSGGGADFISIGVEEGQTQYAGWSVPLGKTAWLLSVLATVDSNKTSNIRCFTRENLDDVSAPMSSKRLMIFWDGVQNSLAFRPNSPVFSISEKGDIWFEVYGDGAVSAVSVDFELLLIDD